MMQLKGRTIGESPQSSSISIKMVEMSLSREQATWKGNRQPQKPAKAPKATPKRNRKKKTNPTNSDEGFLDHPARHECQTQKCKLVRELKINLGVAEHRPRVINVVFYCKKTTQTHTNQKQRINTAFRGRKMSCSLHAAYRRAKRRARDVRASVARS